MCTARKRSSASRAVPTSSERTVGPSQYAISLGVFIGSWVLAAMVYRLKGYDALDVGEPAR
jgi:hypothetical protein